MRKDDIVEAAVGMGSMVLTVLIIFLVPILRLVPTVGAGLLVMAALVLSGQAIMTHVLGKWYTPPQKRGRVHRAIVAVVVALIACIP